MSEELRERAVEIIDAVVDYVVVDEGGKVRVRAAGVNAVVALLASEGVGGRDGLRSRLRCTASYMRKQAEKVEGQPEGPVFAAWAKACDTAVALLAPPSHPAPEPERRAAFIAGWAAHGGHVPVQDPHPPLDDALNRYFSATEEAGCECYKGGPTCPIHY